MRISRSILIFSIAFAILIMTPPFLNQQFGLYPLMKTGDVTDIVTPLILLPLYWILFRTGSLPTTREMIFFLVFVGAWVEGQGMHLSANSIKHLMDDIRTTDTYALTHFYDEVLSHYLWHIGIVGLSALMLWRQIKNPVAESEASRGMDIVSGVIYGFTYPIISIEAGTVPFMLPAAIILILWSFTQRTALNRQPITRFMLVAHGLALILFAIWFVRWGGFPQFSELGMI